MLILGIETSCDETAAAVVEGRRVRSDVVHSQVSLHADYGGVVPELAARDHLANARPVIEQALRDADVTLSDIEALCVTCRPGLSGALLIGTQIASALAWATDKPLIGVDHLVGHLLAVYLEFPGRVCPEPPDFPFLGVLASGGHTALYRVNGSHHTEILEIGATRDDAAGEAYDKVAKLLGLGYPGGPLIDRLAREGDPDAIPLTKPMSKKDTFEFSFSGLKTHVARWVKENGLPENDATLRNLAAAFQRVVTDTLMEKALAAAESEGLSTIALAGGVSANSSLRERGAALCEAQGVRFIVPDFRACTDNAAMIAYAGSFRAQRGEDDRGVLAISPRTILPRLTRKGGGPRAPLDRPPLD